MSQTPCRIRLFSQGSVVILLIANVWLIFRNLHNNQCSPNIISNQEILQSNQITLKKNPKVKIPPRENLSKYNVQVYDVSEGTDTGFNITFGLGRWDKSRMYKMYDFVYVGKNFVSLSQKYSVCMATQSSIEWLYSIVEVSQKWAGPISVALFAAGDEEYFLLHWYVNFLQNCFSTVKLKVSFHLGVSKYKIPKGKYPEKLKEFDKRKYECKEYKNVLTDLMETRSAELVKWRSKSPYPQNHLRNLARKNCQTDFVFLTDVDIVPSWKLAENLDLFLKSSKRKCPGKCAYVIPTFELDVQTDFPKNKKDLIRLVKKGLARAFHRKVFIFNQYATNFTRWQAFVDRSDNEVQISHEVTNFEFLYEPFYVAPDTVPEHDERFLGYGYTRNTQVYEMFVGGYQFQVLSPIFTIHWGLQSRKGRPPWRERQNNLNRHHFEGFKREIFAKYQKDPLKMIN